MACLFVVNFAQLIVARVMASIGEAGCKPPTYSLVGDYFVGSGERTRALTIYIAGSSVSEFLSYVLSGWLNDKVGWRMTLFIAGVPGLFLAALVKLTAVEPRTRLPAAARAAHVSVSLTEAVTSLWKIRSFRQLTFAMILVYVLGTGFYPWYATLLVRVHGMDTAAAGIWLGLIFGVGGIGGFLWVASLRQDGWRIMNAARLV